MLAKRTPGTNYIQYMSILIIGIDQKDRDGSIDGSMTPNADRWAAI